TKISAIAAVAMAAGTAMASATDYLVCDFEDYEIGQTFKVWNNFGDSSTTTATVEADPKNANNKVLHIVNRSWNDHVEFELPEEFAGARFSDRIETLSLKIMRHKNDPCQEWKNFQIFLGEDKLHEESWPSYGPVSTWKTWTYRPAAVSAENTSRMLRIGFNSDNSDYYIDDVRIVGPDFNTYEDGKLDFSDPKSTSSSYTEYREGILIPAGTELNVYTSRYTYWGSPIKGAGTLNIHSGGERSYIGDNTGSLPDWSGFSGDVNIYPWPEVNEDVKAGWYGKILAHGGVKFDAGNVKASIKEGRYTTLLADNHVTLREGSALAGEDGNNARAHRIGRLTMEPGSRLMGYYKGNKTKGVYYLIGSDDSDSELAGQISAEGTSMVGIVKEGNGTYTLTGNNNRITGIATVVEGRLLVSNDAVAAKAEGLPGAIGVGGNSVGVMVYAGATIGGSGNISGMADVYGHMEPGDSNGNILTVADFAGADACDVKLHPTSRLIFNVGESSAFGLGRSEATALIVSGAIILNPRDEAYEESGAMPVLEIKLAEDAQLKAGDSFTLISAASKDESDAEGWKFRIQYPKAYTWEVKETATSESYTVTATVTSTEYSGQGDKIEEDVKVMDGDSNADYIMDWSADYDDPTPLREYARIAGKSIGVAVPVWKFNLSSPGDSKPATTAEQFNLVEAENEMKIDATEPSQNNFSLGSARQLTDFAAKNGMDVRGHTLVWHSQVPGWISQDGKKNNHGWTKDQLTDIMQSHINGVAGGLKGTIREWDVVNECLDDDQSIIWSNPNAYKLRSTVWKDVIGEEFLVKAFRMAHEADPDAKLYINDYGVEFMGDPKAEAYFNLVKKLVEQGAPIDGVGFQCHLTTGQLNAKRLKDNLKRYADLGLEVAVTELDIAQYDPKDANAARIQAEDYCAAVMAALSVENCKTVLIWGLCDPDSWRENNPLIYDGNVKPKEAYYAVHAALRALANRNEVEEIDSDRFAKEVIEVEYYNLQGVRVPSDARGVLIKRTVFSDGSSETVKELR
ncbi:MAG: endo-1,4-beta-xylanase, partial [Muribaculaceae bacterium]|nr:endo-1,4-beta-xylanase [Muribaculaceae bacterium]